MGRRGHVQIYRGTTSDARTERSRRAELADPRTPGQRIYDERAAESLLRIRCAVCDKMAPVRRDGSISGHQSRPGVPCPGGANPAFTAVMCPHGFEKRERGGTNCSCPEYRSAKFKGKRREQPCLNGADHFEHNTSKTTYCPGKQKPKPPKPAVVNKPCELRKARDPHEAHTYVLEGRRLSCIGYNGPVPRAKRKSTAVWTHCITCGRELPEGMETPIHPECVVPMEDTC